MEKFKFSEGELTVQRKVGVEGIASRVARVIKPSVSANAQQFASNVPYLFISSLDEHNYPWISILASNGGKFLSFQNDKLLDIDQSNLHKVESDIFYENIRNNPAVGLLFIYPMSRGRWRINGNIEINNDIFSIAVTQSFPNCPKYIQRRKEEFKSKLTEVENLEVKSGEILTEDLKEMIKNADTFYVGSIGKNGMVDASHRGGIAGFVKFLDEKVLKIPDYSGNNMFTTLGNIYENPKCGLLFIDYTNGSILQLVGKGKLLMDQNSPEDTRVTGGTNRYWTFEIERFRFTEFVLPFNYEFVDYSPLNPAV